MALTLNDDQKSLALTVRRFVAERTPIAGVRAVMESGRGYDREVWSALAGDLGLAGLIIPARYGGGEGSVADLAVALGELGAGLVPSPLLASGVLAADLLLATDDEAAKREWLPKLADGSLVGTVAASEPLKTGEYGSRGWLPVAPSTRTDAARGTLTGVKTAVINGAEADLLLVPATEPTEDGIGIYLVQRDAAGLSVSGEPVLDQARPVATVRFDATPAVRLAGDADEAQERIADLANVALAAEQLGAMAACVVMTSEYAKVRYTFGQPIGAYQGVKHKLADAYADWALADAALRAATEAAGDPTRDFRAAAGAARVLASPAYVRAARDAMLLHGGIGYTWEHDAHLYYKNALAGQVLLGTTDQHLERLAERLAI